MIMSSSSSADHIFVSGQETTTRHVHAAHTMQVAHMLPSALPRQGASSLHPSTPQVYDVVQHERLKNKGQGQGTQQKSQFLVGLITAIKNKLPRQLTWTHDQSPMSCTGCPCSDLTGRRWRPHASHMGETGTGMRSASFNADVTPGPPTPMAPKEESRSQETGTHGRAAQQGTQISQVSPGDHPTSFGHTV